MTASENQPALHANEALNREEVVLDLISVYLWGMSEKGFGRGLQ